MTGDNKTTAIGPWAYPVWRATALGALTETLEQRLMLDLLGDLAGVRVLDIGCGDDRVSAAWVDGIRASSVRAVAADRRRVGGTLSAAARRRSETR